MPAQRFSIASSRLSAGQHLVAAAGEVDLHVAPQLAAELERLEREGAERIVVDLSDVPFLDSSGIGVLLAASKRLGPSRLSIVAPGAEVRRVLELTGADRVLNVVGDPGSTA